MNFYLLYNYAFRAWNTKLTLLTDPFYGYSDLKCVHVSKLGEMFFFNFNANFVTLYTQRKGFMKWKAQHFYPLKTLTPQKPNQGHKTQNQDRGRSEATMMNRTSGITSELSFDANTRGKLNFSQKMKLSFGHDNFNLEVGYIARGMRDLDYGWRISTGY